MPARIDFADRSRMLTLLKQNNQRNRLDNCVPVLCLNGYGGRPRSTDFGFLNHWIRCFQRNVSELRTLPFVIREFSTVYGRKANSNSTILTIVQRMTCPTSGHWILPMLCMELGSRGYRLSVWVPAQENANTLSDHSTRTWMIALERTSRRPTFLKPEL
jgi:hypothetical protein